MKKDAATLTAAIELFAAAVETLGAVAGFPAHTRAELDRFVAGAREELQDLARWRAELAARSPRDPAVAALKAQIAAANRGLPGLRTALNQRITGTELELVGPPAGESNPGYVAFHAWIRQIYALPR